MYLQKKIKFIKTYFVLKLIWSNIPKYFVESSMTQKKEVRVFINKFQENKTNKKLKILV